MHCLSCVDAQSPAWGGDPFPRGGAVGAGGCARLRCPRLGFATRGRCGPSPGVIQLRGRGTGGRGKLGCLRLSRRPPIAPEFPAYVAPVACSPLIWSPGGRSPQPPTLQARSDTPRETRQNSRRQWPSRLLSPLSPPADRPRVSSAYITVPDDRPAHVRRKTSRPSRPSAVCGQQTPESALRAAAAARPTTGRFQRLSGMVRISDVPHWTKSTGTIPP